MADYFQTYDPAVKNRFKNIFHSLVLTNVEAGNFDVIELTPILC